MANKNYIFGKGSFALMRRDATTGLYSLMAWAGNVPMFKMGFKKDRVEHFESESGANVKDVSLTKTIEGEGQMTIEEISKENAALLFGGTVVNASGETFTDEPLTGSTTPVVGQAYKLGGNKITTFTQLEDSVGVVDPSKYSVDLNRGVVRILSVASVTGPLTATYTTPARKIVRMADDFDAEFAIVGFLINKANGNKKMNVEVFRITIDPPNDVDFISDDLIKCELKFQALRDEVKAPLANYGQFARLDYIDDVDTIVRTTTV